MSHLVTPVTDRKIRFGFVGCGRISNKNFEALEQHAGDIDVVAVCDIVEERAKDAAKRMDATPYTDLKMMLESEDLDIITVATPNGLHPEHVMMAADAGVHVVTEKPMAIKWEDGLKINSYCKEKNVQLFVIHQNRLNDTVQEVWKALDTGRFGKIYMRKKLKTQSLLVY